MTTGSPWTYPWAGWIFVLLEMYQGRRKLFQDLAGRPTWTCAGRPLHNATARALWSRGLVVRSLNNGRGRITWSLTNKGRRVAKEILR